MYVCQMRVCTQQPFLDESEDAELHAHLMATLVSNLPYSTAAAPFLSKLPRGLLCRCGLLQALQCVAVWCSVLQRVTVESALLCSSCALSL